MSSSSSPCAACKCLRRKCTAECVFAPYFPPDNLQKFADVHKVYGASNVSKLLNELDPARREDAVRSLSYEAAYRLHDPVYGCVGLIATLQDRLKQFKLDLESAEKELGTYIGPLHVNVQENPNFGPEQPMNHQGFMQQLGPGAGLYQVMPYDMQMGLSAEMAQLMMRNHEPQPQQQQLVNTDIKLSPEQQQFLKAQQMAAAEQEMMRTYQQQQHHSGFDEAGRDPVTATGFNQVSADGAAAFSWGSSYGTFSQYNHDHQVEVKQQQLHRHTHNHHHQVQQQQLHRHRHNHHPQVEVQQQQLRRQPRTPASQPQQQPVAGNAGRIHPSS